MGLPPVTLAELEAMAEPVEAPNGTVIAYLPLAQLVAFLEARDTRWKLALEQTERKLAAIVTAAVRMEVEEPASVPRSPIGCCGPGLACDHQMGDCSCCPCGGGALQYSGPMCERCEAAGCGDGHGPPCRALNAFAESWGGPGRGEDGSGGPG